MSAHVRIRNVALFQKVLQTVAVTKEAIVTLFLTSDVMVLHSSTEDQACTSAATLPVAALFSEYASSGDPRFMVSAAALLDALRMVQPSITSTGSSSSHAATFTMSYPAGDGRLLVQIDDESHPHRRCVQSTLATHPVRDRLLDLRFGDSIIENVTSVRCDSVLTEAIMDLVAFQCAQVRVEFTPQQLRLVGLHSPLGNSASVSIGKSLECMLRFEVGNSSNRPLYRLQHFAAACGLGGLRSSSHSRRGAGGDMSSGVPQNGGGSYFAPWNVSSDVGGGAFERTTLSVNAERQLCVSHSVNIDSGTGGAALPVVVSIVISCLSEIDLI